MIFMIGAVCVLLLLSAFFSGSETALTGASEAFMHDKEKNEGNKRAALVKKLFKQRDSLIITTLIGSNLSNTLATALSTSLMISLFGDEGVVYATLLMTVLVLIYTDMLPKSFSVQHANKMALAVAPLMATFTKVFYPVTIVLQWIVNISFKIFGLKKVDFHDEQDDLSELRGVIHMYDGKSRCQEKEMLKSVLDLADVDVYDVMNHRKNLFAIDVDLPIADIVEKVKDCPFSRIPLYRGNIDNIVGIIRVRILLKEAFDKKDSLEDVKIEEIMNEPWFIPETTNLLQQLLLFRAKREHFAFVVDEYGVLQGIVTLEDILEEIVGDINDECDVDTLDMLAIKKCSDGAFIVDGQVAIRDLNRKFGWELDDENASTVAGYLLDATQSIPEEGQKFVFQGFELGVVNRNKNQIVSVKIRKLEEILV